MQHLKLVELKKSEMNEINGGFRYLIGLFTTIDVIEAFIEGLEEGYKEKCGCKSER